MSVLCRHARGGVVAGLCFFLNSLTPTRSQRFLFPFLFLIKFEKVIERRCRQIVPLGIQNKIVFCKIFLRPVSLC